MATYIGKVQSRRSQADTFAYMAHFENVSAWDPTVVEAKQLTSGEPGVGTRFLVRVRLLGRETAYTYEITEFQPPQRLVLRAEANNTTALDTVEVEAAGTGAQLTYNAKIELQSTFGRLLDPLVGLLFQRLGDNAAQGLRRELGNG